MSLEIPSERPEIIEFFARLLFTREEILLILGESAEKMHPDEQSFQKGKLLAEAEVRLSLLKSATTGSAPAQKQWLDLAKTRQKRGPLPWPGLKKRSK